MQQALHIFKKDLRALWLDVLMMFTFTTVFAWVHAVGAPLTPQYLGVLLVLESMYVTAKVVLSEPVPGTNPFWLTRPYQWWSLLAAKLLFIVLFIHVPVLIARAVILASADFSIWHNLPGLLWSQLFMFLCISVPVAALASMSTSLLPFVGVLIAAAAILVAVPYVPLLPRFLPAARGTELEWVPYAAFFTAAMVVGSITLLLQYKTRRTVVTRTLAVVLLGSVIIGLINLSFDSVWWGQLQTGATVDASRYYLRLSEHPRRPPRQSGPRVVDGGRLLQLFLTFGGVGADEELRVHRLKLSLLKDDEIIQTTDVIPIRGGGSLRDSIGANLILDSDNLPRDDAAVTIQGSAYFSIFRQTQPAIPVADIGDIELQGGLRCGLRQDAFIERFDVGCISPLRMPSAIITIGNTFLFQPSYSPFPGDLRMEPLRFGEHHLRSYRSTDVVWVTAKELIGHARKDFRFENVGLTNYLWPPQ